MQLAHYFCLFPFSLPMFTLLVDFYLFSIPETSDFDDKQPNDNVFQAIRSGILMICYYFVAQITSK